MYQLFLPYLFHLDPESAHSFTIRLLRLAGFAPGVATLLRRRFQAPSKPVKAFGLRFTNPVGLAAGYDKDALAWRGLASLGFGHIEIGTVTPKPQLGNPRPRIFRLPEDSALINRMGFPGRGAEFVARRLRKPRPPGLVLGVNLGKSVDTPLDNAVQDYIALMQVFAPLADYLVINVSSPNTEGLRRLQARQALDALLIQLREEKQYQEVHIGGQVPLLVKLSPDLTGKELEDALDVILDRCMDGVIATNTTIDREGLKSSHANELGGLSGRPLKKRSTAMVREICRLTGGKIPVIGVGGVMNVDDAKEKLEAGAVLVQIYTGLVYKGPGFVKEILQSL